MVSRALKLSIAQRNRVSPSGALSHCRERTHEHANTPRTATHSHTPRTRTRHALTHATHSHTPTGTPGATYVMGSLRATFSPLLARAVPAKDRRQEAGPTSCSRHDSQASVRLRMTSQMHCMSTGDSVAQFPRIRTIQPSRAYSSSPRPKHTALARDAGGREAAKGRCPHAWADRERV